MVDFNNDTTIGTPAADVVKILLLEKRNNLIEALEVYKKFDNRDVQADLSIVRARLLSLFLDVQAAFKRRIEPGEYEKIKIRVLQSKEEEEILEVIYLFNEYLDDIRLTRIDNKKTYDPTEVGNEDKIKGFS